MKLVSVAELHAMPAGTIFSHTDDEDSGPYPYCDGIHRKGESNEPVTAFNFAQLELLPQPLMDRPLDGGIGPRVCRCRHSLAEDQTLYGVGMDDAGDRFWVWEPDDIRSLIDVLTASLEKFHGITHHLPS